MSKRKEYAGFVKTVVVYKREGYSDPQWARYHEVTISCVSLIDVEPLPPGFTKRRPVFIGECRPAIGSLIVIRRSTRSMRHRNWKYWEIVTNEQT